MIQAYCIVDIETTGNGIKGNKITEIAIFRFENGRISREFHSLVNPGCEIPRFITALTGIDANMVRNAPGLGDLAGQILEITKDSIFVAHSVNFDYHVIKNEFRELGIDFCMKRLCTVRLSRSIFPGLHSYSLGKLCASLDIPLTDRHRARGDAMATVSLFRKILDSEQAENLIKGFLNARSQEATLPPELPGAVYRNLPEKTGVYYFRNTSGQVIYVGKAKNIKKRVLSHFYDKSDKEARMCRETADIDFELSGSELVALLMESAAIKQLYPLYNRSQKRQIPQYAIFCYTDRRGIRHLAYNRIKGIPNPLASFYSITDCRLYLEKLCSQFGLCPKYCHLQEQTEGCNHFRISSCQGICRGTEAVQDYNAKVEAAITDAAASNCHLIIKEKGRTVNETAIILVKDGMYSGYGFIDREQAVPTLQDAMAYITPQKNTPETERLLHTYSMKHPENTIVLTVKEVDI